MVKIQNFMEDVVLEKVKEVFSDKEAKAKKNFCICSQCYLDVSCFVLNRIQPVYMLSGRGLAHMQSHYQEKLQQQADLVSLIREGIDHVDQAKRPHFSHSREGEESLPEGFFYNFPQITGRLFNSVNFEPVCGATVSLLFEGEAVVMVDSNWQNPYAIVQNTAGIFSFWPYPQVAKASFLKNSYEFELQVEKTGFQTLRHYFELVVDSREGFLNLSGGDKIFTIKDLYLNPQ